MGFEVLHGIVDCLWVTGEPISAFKEAVERETGILTEVDTYDWIAFLPMSDGTGAYNRYFGRLNTGKIELLSAIRFQLILYLARLVQFFIFLNGFA